MYISYRSREEAISEADLDSYMFKSLLEQAQKKGETRIILNSETSTHFLEDDNHPYQVYLDTLTSNIPGTRWLIEESNFGSSIILEWGPITLQLAA